MQKQQKIFSQLEEKIAGLKKRTIELEALLASPDTYSDKNKFIKVETEYKQALDQLLLSNQQYEKTFEKIVELENYNK